MAVNTARTHRVQAQDLSYGLSLRVVDVARRLLGEPNRKQSSKRELRWGNHGSMRIHIAGPKRGQWDDFESGQGGDLLDLIQREQRCSFPDALKFAEDLLGIRHDEAKPKPASTKPRTVSVRKCGLIRNPHSREPEDDASRIRYALQIWDEAEPIVGTLGAIYLSKRGIDLDAVPDLHSVLRWHPRCPWGNGHHSCIVALWMDIISAKPKAIHRRPITAEGEKVDRWKALGPSSDCCIRLWPDDWIEQGLVLGEGIETTLAASTRIEYRGTLLRPAWAAGDADHIRHFSVLPGLETLTILVDHDRLNPKTGKHPGQDAAATCSQRWHTAGREVIRFVPQIVGSDFNDIVMREQSP